MWNDSDDYDGIQYDTMHGPATVYTCGRCCETFPPGITGHTEGNPCSD